MRKHVLGHMHTEKAQISLHICTVWSGPSVSTTRIIGHCRMLEWRAKACMIFCVCAGWSESAHFVHVRRHIFTWCSPVDKARYEKGIYSKTCVREPSSRLTLNSGWCGKSCLSYKGTCHVILLVILLANYMTCTFIRQPPFHINH